MTNKIPKELNKLHGKAFEVDYKNKFKSLIEQSKLKNKTAYVMNFKKTNVEGTSYVLKHTKDIKPITGVEMADYSNRLYDMYDTFEDAYEVAIEDVNKDIEYHTKCLNICLEDKKAIEKLKETM